MLLVNQTNSKPLHRTAYRDNWLVDTTGIHPVGRRPFQRDPPRGKVAGLLDWKEKMVRKMEEKEREDETLEE